MADTRSHRTNPSKPLDRLLESTLTVADIVSTPFWCIKPDMPAQDALAAMNAHSFDVGGVGPDPTRSFVHRDDLLKAGTGPVSLYAKPIDASLCIEKSLPVATLLQLFKNNDRLFVLDGNLVRWVVTHADLDAPAVSVAVLSFLVIIEAGLKELANGLHDSQIKDTLKSKSRIQKADGVQAGRPHETRWRDCLQLVDWLNICKRTPGHLEEFGYPSIRAFEQDTDAFGDMRNDLAHGRQLITTNSGKKMVDRIAQVRAFSDTVWRAVEHRRTRWEQYADTVIVGSGDPQTIYAGPSAIEEWEYSKPVYVITAWNPGSVWMSEERNAANNAALRKILGRRGGLVVDVVGQSQDGIWQEDSFLVSGIDGHQISELAALFGQLAYFELTKDEMRVCDSATGQIVEPVPLRKR